MVPLPRVEVLPEGLPEPRVAAGAETRDAVWQYLKDIRDIPLLTAEQEVELAQRIEAGDDEAAAAVHPVQPAPGGQHGQALHRAGARP